MNRKHTREQSGIRLDREGQWWHDGERVEHPRIVDAFNRGLSPTDDGRFKLVVGPDWCFVEVEDAAYRVQAVGVGDEVTLSLSDGAEEALDPATLRLEADGVFVCTVKQGRAKARFSRQSQVSLGEHLEGDVAGMVLVTRKGRIALPQVMRPRD